MNAAVQEVAQATDTALATLPAPQRAAITLRSAETEKELLALAQQHRDIVEVTNKDGRDQAHRAYMVLRSTRVEIEKRAKSAREDATAFSRAVIAEEKRLVALIDPEEARLQKLRDDWDDAEERARQAVIEAEQQRVAKIDKAIDDFRRLPMMNAGNSAACIAANISNLEQTQLPPDFFAERLELAQTAKDETLQTLRRMRDERAAFESEQERLRIEREEADQREQERLARQREEEARIAAERENLAAERAEQERKEREAQEREEQARRDREAEQAKIIQAQREVARGRAANELQQYFNAALTSSQQINTIELLQVKHSDVIDCPVDNDIHGNRAPELRDLRTEVAAAISNRIRQLHNAELERLAEEARQREAEEARQRALQPAKPEPTPAPPPAPLTVASSEAEAAPVVDAEYPDYPGYLGLIESVATRHDVTSETAIQWLRRWATEDAA